MTPKFAIVFPGQGSQSVGMLSDLAEQYACVKETFAEASDRLGYDMWSLVQNGPVEELNKTEVTQPVMLVAGVAVWRVWRERHGPLPLLMAGHSLGEYSALVCAESLALADAVKLVQLRGRFMQEAVPQGVGGMAAILGLDDSEIEKLCAEISGEEVVSCANYNSPGQVVVGGHKSAIDRLSELAKEAGAKKVLPVAMSVPSHCPLMKPAAERLALELEAIELSKPTISIVNNVEAKIEFEPQAIKDALIRQVYHPVRWVSVVEQIAEQGITHIVECGPGKVLSGLNKRIIRSIQALPMLNLVTMEKCLEMMAAESVLIEAKN